MWTSHEITAGGLKIHYLRTGGGGPPLVLAHGATDNGGCWVRLATALADTFDVIVPDARGMACPMRRRAITRHPRSVTTSPRSLRHCIWTGHSWEGTQWVRTPRLH